MQFARPFPDFAALPIRATGPGLLGCGRNRDRDIVLLDNRVVRIEPERPYGGADDEQGGRHDERRLPIGVLGQIAEYQGRKRPADVTGHVHHSGHGPGIFSAGIHRDRPGGTDGAFQEEARPSQAIDGRITVLRQRGRNNEHDATQHADNGDHAAGELGVSSFFQEPISCQAADRIPDHHGKKRQRRQEADLEQRKAPGTPRRPEPGSPIGPLAASNSPSHPNTAPGSTSLRAFFPSSPAPSCATSVSPPDRNSRIASWLPWTTSTTIPSSTHGPTNSIKPPDMIRTLETMN